jgi:hypothetical protein
MLCREIIVANSENHGKKHKYALWEISRIYLIINEAGVTFNNQCDSG